MKINPGANDVDESAWGVARGLPVVSALLALGERGGFTVEGASTPKAVDAEPVPLPEALPNKESELISMNVIKSVKAINDCDDAEKIASWLEGESRKTVISAIEKRLTALQDDDVTP